MLFETVGKAYIAAMSATTISPSGFDLTPPTAEQRKQLEASLTREEADVLLHHGTEAPFCGGLLDQKDAGIYCCRLCGLPLFEHKTKFESGTGWPSFWAPVDEAHVKAVKDISYGMVRIETLCARCGSHQGHVFPDGPPPTGCATASIRCRWSSCLTARPCPIAWSAARAWRSPRAARPPRPETAGLPAARWRRGGSTSLRRPT